MTEQSDDLLYIYVTDGDNPPVRVTVTAQQYTHYLMTGETPSLPLEEEQSAS